MDGRTDARDTGPCLMATQFSRSDHREWFNLCTYISFVSTCLSSIRARGQTMEARNKQMARIPGRMRRNTSENERGNSDTPRCGTHQDN
ncbi:hypothetical protein LZ32DRAFT_600344 [Colletotrichum eremochloae]|nr:hypothetical protein LZ32DRAFT_600344 [Colletotrichum eremochloae]